MATNSNKKIVIRFDHSSYYMGGFGDRVVGIISVWLLSKNLNYDFYISWERENVKKYIDYSKYDFDKIKNEIKSAKIYNYIDNQKGLKNYLSTTPFKNLFPETNNIFYLNQEISQYLYQNKDSTSNFLEDILKVYRKLYEEILIPTDQMKSLIDKLITNEHKKIIGIQIRAGDSWMGVDKTHRPIDSDEFIINKLKNIRIFLDKQMENEENSYSVFITSDHPRIKEIAFKIFKNCIYNDRKIVHIDRTPGAHEDDLSKIFVDNYILAKKTELLIISEYSNFGRIAALSSGHKFCYDLNLNKIKVETLLSKHELLIDLKDK